MWDRHRREMARHRRDHIEPSSFSRRVRTFTRKSVAFMAHTVAAANNYASDLISLERFKEAKTVLRKTLPVARRVLGESHEHLSLIHI